MSQLTLKTPSTGQTGSGPLAWLSRAGFGVITLLAIALFGWANPVFLTFDNWANLMTEIGRAVQQECRDRSRMPSSA